MFVLITFMIFVSCDADASEPSIVIEPKPIRIEKTSRDTVTESYITIGEYINEDGPYFKTMISIDLKEKLENLQEAELRFNNGVIEKAVVHKISSTPDPLSRLYETKLKFNSAKVEIGDYAEIKFIINQYEAVLMPSKAIVRDGNEQYIYKYDNQKLERIVVETGLSLGNLIELKGFENNFYVVVSGQNFVSENDEIMIVE